MKERWDFLQRLNEQGDELVEKIKNHNEEVIAQLEEGMDSLRDFLLGLDPGEFPETEETFNRVIINDNAEGTGRAVVIMLPGTSLDDTEFSIDKLKGKSEANAVLLNGITDPVVLLILYTNLQKEPHKTGLDIQVLRNEDNLNPVLSDHIHNHSLKTSEREAFMIHPDPLMARAYTDYVLAREQIKDKGRFIDDRQMGPFNPHTIRDLFDVLNIAEREIMMRRVPVVQTPANVPVAST